MTSNVVLALLDKMRLKWSLSSSVGDLLESIHGDTSIIFSVTSCLPLLKVGPEERANPLNRPQSSPKIYPLAPESMF